MKNNFKGFALAIVLAIWSNTISAQHDIIFSSEKDVNSINNEHNPCISYAQYEEIEQEIIKNRKTLHLDSIYQHKSANPTLLQWPLEPSSKMTDCGYYYISAYVDQNTAAGQIQDWNCGARTYDGHRGVDIVAWPFIWNKMDSNLVRVIAAAPGTIIAKVDGNPDRVCNGVGGGNNSNNYITIQHADGSTALYVHLKTGSFTTKTVGQTVSTGEYLGIVGSAGQSTGAHLHFEIRSDGTFANFVDPFYGPCNSATTSTWWASQKPYEDPALLKLSLHSSWPYMGVCPNTVDTLYEVDHFISNPGAQAIFYASTRDVASNAPWTFKILDPNNNTYDSWNFTNNATPRRTSTLGFNKTLPATPGTYTFQATFNGNTCNKTFTIQSTTGLNDTTNEENSFPYPNPTKGEIVFQKPFEFIAVFNSLGQAVLYQRTAVNIISISGLPDGVYFIKTDNLSHIIIKR